jgi:preprotein translocase subunit SecD
MRRRCRGLLPLVAGFASVLMAAGCNGGSSQAASASVSPGLLNGAVTLSAGRPLTSGEQRQVRSVLQARLAALHIDAIVTMAGDRAIRLQVPGPTVTVVRKLGAPGRFEVRPVETSGAKGQQPAAPTGSVPTPVARSAGRCRLTAPGDAQGWLVACDVAQHESYLLWPAELTNSDVASASEVASQPNGDWQVTVSFTSAGQRRFFLLTQRSVGMQLALVVDGVVQSAPVIQKAIDGDAELAVDLDHSRAQLLATLVGNGVLPVALRPQAG